MPTPRMASGPILLSAVWALTLISGSAAQSIKLGADITSFVPTCAQNCFQSYVDDNFKSGTCGSSLSCLCSQTGATGYTLGEFALICMTGQASNGECVGEDAKQEKISQAYGMCVGQANAAPITHSSIVATVSVSPDRVRPTMPILAPRPTESGPQSVTSTLTDSGRDAPPTIVTETSAFTGTTKTPNPSAAPSTSPEASRAPLETVQIVGIVVGVGGGILLAIGLFLLFWCLRRRKQEQARSDGRSSKLRDSWSVIGAPLGAPPGGPRSLNGSPYVMQISKPVLTDRQQPDFARAVGQPANVRPEATSLAMGAIPAPLALVARQGTPTRHAQEGAGPAVPEKPRLTLYIPKQGAIPPPPPLKHAPPLKPTPAVPGAAPAAMPFSSGRDSVVTEFAEDGEGTLSAGGAQIYRQPKSADPQASTTYYVADKVGNWVVGNNSQQSNVMELEGSSPMGAVVAGTRQGPPGHAMTTSTRQPLAMTAIPGTQTSQAAKSRAMSTTSSTYSTTNFSKPVSQYPAPNVPTIEVSKPIRVRQLTKGVGRSDTVASERSTTTFASSTASGDFGDLVVPIQKNLSPVAESPLKSPVEGVSPVTYPKIPGRQPSKLQLFAIPGGNQEQRPGQGAPGFLVPANSGDSSNSRVGRSLLNPNPNRNPAQIRTGSPNVPQEPPKSQQTPARHASPRPHQAGQRDSKPALMSANFASVPASSLASKRLGADRAAALALPNQQPGGSVIGGSRAQGKWQRDNTGGQQGAPGVFIEGLGQVPLPSTPGWTPKLTPKKMGNDLFLSVG